jgi:hypothetical protein
VSNRRISEFPAINGIQVDEQDLLTLVHVFEADPTLRNKKITFSQFKEYLNQYYPSVSGTTFNGNIVINGDLTVTGSTSVGVITFTDLVTLSGAIVQNSLYASGTVGAFTVTGVDSIFTNQVVGTGRFLNELSGHLITGNTIRATNITGISGVFTTAVTSNFVSGNTVQTNTINAISGIFTAEVSGQTVTGNTIKGASITGISGVFTQRLYSPTITGNTVSATTGSFNTLVTSGHIVQDDLVVSGDLGVSGATQLNTVTGNSANFTTLTGSTAGFTTVTGQTVTGINANFASGTFTNNLSGAVITGQTINASNLNAVSGVFTSRISGQTVTGGIANFTSGAFQSLTAVNMTFGGDQTISGSFTVLGAGSYGSGLVVTGAITGDTAGFTTITGTTVTGTTANFVTVSGTTVTGQTGLFTDITGSTLHITTPSGATAALVCSGVVSGDTNGFVIKSPLIILP